MSAVVPTAREVLDAAKVTRLLLKLRWRGVRTLRARIYLILGALGFFTALSVAAQAGSVIRMNAEDGPDSPAGEFAITYIQAFNQGDLGGLGAAVIGSVFFASFLAPLSGVAMQSLVSPEDLAGLRPNRLHRYFDSMLCNAVSAIGFFQLVTLTILGSLLTIDGDRTGGLLFMWLLWPFLVLLSTSEGWAIELLSRRYGTKATKIAGLAFAGAIALALLFDPNHGSTLFGLGDSVLHTVTATASGDFTLLGHSLAILTIATTAATLAGLCACRAALALPATVRKNNQATRRVFPMSTRPTTALIQVLMLPLLRSPEVRRPLAAITIVGLPAVWISPNDNIMVTLVVAVPLSVGLAFGVNVFGVIGPGLTWFASQPRLMNRLLVYTSLMQFAVTLLCAALLWAPATLAGRVTPSDALAVAAGTIVAAAFATRSCAHKSLTQPILVRLGSRGDVIVPPVAAINYTLRLSAWSGLLGVLVMNTDGWLRLALVLTALAWTTLRYQQLARQWRRREVQAFVTVQVSAT